LLSIPNAIFNILYTPLAFHFFPLLLQRPPSPTLFPYTTLFRSCHMPDRRHLWRGVHHPEMVRSGVTIDASAGASRYRPGEIVKRDRKSTRLNSSHVAISYAVFCLKKKKMIVEHSEIAWKTGTSA